MKHAFKLICKTYAILLQNIALVLPLVEISMHILILLYIIILTLHTIHIFCLCSRYIINILGEGGGGAYMKHTFKLIYFIYTKHDLFLEQSTILCACTHQDLNAHFALYYFALHIMHMFVCVATIHPYYLRLTKGGGIHEQWIQFDIQSSHCNLE